MPASLASRPSLLHSRRPQPACQFSCDHSATFQVAKPGELALGEVPAAPLDLADHLLQAGRAVQMSEQLLVSQRLGRLPAEWTVELPQSLHLLDESGGNHLLHASVDAAVQLL